MILFLSLFFFKITVGYTCNERLPSACIGHHVGFIHFSMEPVKKLGLEKNLMLNEFFKASAK